MNDVNKFHAMEKALKVFLLTPATRQFLKNNDPKALEQAERALNDSETVKQAEEALDYWCSHRETNTYPNGRTYTECDLVGCICFEPGSKCPANKEKI